MFYKAFVEVYNAVVENREPFMTRWNEQNESDDDLLKRATAKGFIGIFKYAEVIKEFNVDLFFKFVEIITVCDGEKLIVSLLDGIEIEVKTE